MRGSCRTTRAVNTRQTQVYNNYSNYIVSCAVPSCGKNEKIECGDLRIILYSLLRTWELSGVPLGLLTWSETVAKPIVNNVWKEWTWRSANSPTVRPTGGRALGISIRYMQLTWDHRCTMGKQWVKRMNVTISDFPYLACQSSRFFQNANEPYTIKLRMWKYFCSVRRQKIEHGSLRIFVEHLLMR